VKKALKTVRSGVSAVQPWTPPSEVARPARWERIQPWLHDLVLTVVWALLGVGAVLLDMPTVPRVVFGLPLVLFLPGYALTSALFPGRDGPDGIERIALGLGLSLATLPIVALALNYSPWLLSTTALTISLAGACFTASAVSLTRRRKLPASERYKVVVAPPPIPDPRQWDRSVRITSGVAALSIVVLAAGGIPVVLNRMAGDHLTEFALYTNQGDTGFYTRQLTVGEPAEVDLSVTNREGKTVSYTVAITGAGHSLDEPPSITLADGETWRQPVRFAVAEAGDNLPVRFELRRTDRSDESEPYRTLQLMVDAQTPAVRASD
jgi:uncharacterized membrane protein